MSLNANVTAVCPTPSCEHNYKVDPRGEGFEHGRTFDGICANCGRTEMFFLFDLQGLQEHDQALASTVAKAASKA